MPVLVYGFFIVKNTGLIEAAGYGKREAPMEIGAVYQN